MECPRCGLCNSSSAQRCDCGYDFLNRCVEGPYLNQKLSMEIKVFAALVIAANVAGAILTLSQWDPGRVAAVITWSCAVYGLYIRFVKKDNWARIALGVVTFPIGLILYLSPEAKLYCLQK